MIACYMPQGPLGYRVGKWRHRESLLWGEGRPLPSVRDAASRAEGALTSRSSLLGPPCAAPLWPSPPVGGRAEKDGDWVGRWDKAGQTDRLTARPEADKTISIWL